MTSLNSLRDICLCLKAHNNKLHHLGIKSYVNQTTFSRANENMDWKIFADFGKYLIEQIRTLYQLNEISNVGLDN